MKVFVGYDIREDIAYQVCEHSIHKHQSNAEVLALKQSELRDRGIYTRSIDPLSSTEFTFVSDTADGSVTYKMDVTFKAPCYQGDLIFIDAEVVDTGEKSITVNVKAYREQRENRRTKQDSYKMERVEVAEANFVFISIRVIEKEIQEKPYFLPYVKHGLTIKSI
jgi:acyl-CoA hydrolase